jgi:small subunit ribosomal protein S16
LAVKLRLLRMGKKKQPFYRIVAVDSKKRRDGKYLEKIGHYNPLKEPAEIVIDKEIAFKWLDLGAIPTDTVKSFLSRDGLLMEWDLRKKGFDEERITSEMKKWETIRLENQKRIEAELAMKKREADREMERQARDQAKQQEAEAKAKESETQEEEPSGEAPHEEAVAEESQEEIIDQEEKQE